MTSTPTKPAVRHWTSRNDPNHTNRHAECQGVEFCAMPHQPMLGRRGRWLVLISGILCVGNETETGHKSYKTWAVQIRLCLQDGSGQTKHEVYKRFGGDADGTNATDEDRDDAIRWAAEQLLKP